MIRNISTDRLKTLLEYLNNVPFDVSPGKLYDAENLYSGYDPNRPETFAICLDSRIYQHFLEKGKQADTMEESMARTLHDHSVREAMREFLRKYDPRDCVGIMGGHALLRTDPAYRTIVSVSKKLTEQGVIMLSGGGPGAMEATHLGAWMAGRTDKEVDDALNMLEKAPSFRDEGWLQTAFAVRKKYQQNRYVSLGIPTWLYGHEPSTPFATHIAKLFENSIREDSILTYAYGGIIYTPGSAGTMQEIFQEAVQNHYLSFGFSSPMIFLGKQYWTDEMPAFTLLKALMDTGKYKNLLLTLSDDADEIIDVLLKFRHAGS